MPNKYSTQTHVYNLEAKFQKADHDMIILGVPAD